MNFIPLNRINAKEYLQVQRYQNQYALYLTDTIAAGATRLASVAVSPEGDFLCQHITLSYTTVDGGPAADTGLDYIRARIIDGNGQKPLFSDLIPLGLWGTPGRRKSLAAGGSDSNQIQVVFPWEYMFISQGSIIIEARSDATAADNSYSIAFWGIRVNSNVSP